MQVRLRFRSFEGTHAPTHPSLRASIRTQPHNMHTNKGERATCVLTSWLGRMTFSPLKATRPHACACRESQARASQGLLRGWH